MPNSLLGKLCTNCGERPATQKWVGEGGALAMTHGLYETWCNRCVLVAQIAYAEQQAQRLPGLRDRLAGMDES